MSDTVPEKHGYSPEKPPRPNSSNRSVSVSVSAVKQNNGPVPKWKDDPWGFRAILLFIIFCAATGLGFVLPGLDNESLRVSLFALQPILICLIVILLFVLHYVDPGIVPPSTLKDEEIVVAETGKIPSDLIIDSHGQWARRKLLQDGRCEITQRYCNTCNIWREPRTSHCSRCGYCMERFDHHCGAVGVCIARKNHRFFTLFLFVASASSGLFLYACILRLHQTDWSRYRVLLSSPGELIYEWDVGRQTVQTVVLVFLSLIYFYTSLLFCFAIMHFTILFCDCTTKQYILRGRRGRHINWNRPSITTWLKNMSSVCCAEVQNKNHVEKLKDGQNGGPSMTPMKSSPSVTPTSSPDRSPREEAANPQVASVV